MYRRPTAADIGREVEASANGEGWEKYTLVGIWQSVDQTRYHTQCNVSGVTYVAEHCRVPYSSRDLIAELSEAADAMASVGADEAALVLMQFLAMDAITQDAFMAYRPG